MEIQKFPFSVNSPKRGLGRAFAQAGLPLKAENVYDAVRNSKGTLLPNVHALRRDVTRSEDTDAESEIFFDVNVPINDAEIWRSSPVLPSGEMEDDHADFETSRSPKWRINQTLATVLVAHGGGAIIKVLSAFSWVNLLGASIYCISKSAGWVLSNALLNEPMARSTQMLGSHGGFMDTSLTTGIHVPKVRADDVALPTLSALVAVSEEILFPPPAASSIVTLLLIPTFTSNL